MQIDKLQLEALIEVAGDAVEILTAAPMIYSLGHRGIVCSQLRREIANTRTAMEELSDDDG